MKQQKYNIGDKKLFKREINSNKEISDFFFFFIIRKKYFSTFERTNSKKCGSITFKIRMNLEISICASGKLIE